MIFCLGPPFQETSDYSNEIKGLYIKYHSIHGNFTGIMLIDVKPRLINHMNQEGTPRIVIISYVSMLPSQLNSRLGCINPELISLKFFGSV